MIVLVFRWVLVDPENQGRRVVLVMGMVVVLFSRSMMESSTAWRRGMVV